MASYATEDGGPTSDESERISRSSESRKSQNENSKTSFSEDKKGKGLKNLKSSGSIKSISKSSVKDSQKSKDVLFPKKKSSVKNKGGVSSEIIISKNVQLYKLENNKYINLGNVTITLKGNFELKYYQLTLHKTKKNNITEIQLSPDFEFRIMNNNYVSFYDASGQNWSVLYSSAADLQEFSKQIAIAKYYCQDQSQSIITQDLSLVPEDGSKAKPKDTVRVKYNSYTLDSLSNKTEIDKNVMNVEIDGPNSPPWNRGLSGCCEQCKRVIIVPYNMSDPWKNDLQSNKAVLLEIEVQKIVPKEYRNTYKDEQINTKSPEEVKNRCRTDNCDQKCCETKDLDNWTPKSVTDTIFLSRSHKMDLFSRIAKIGMRKAQCFNDCKGIQGQKENENVDDAGASTSFKDQKGCNEENCEPLPSKRKMQQTVGESYPSTTKKFQADKQNHVYQAEMSWQKEQIRGGYNIACQELKPYVTGPPDFDENEISTVGAQSDLRITINKVSEKMDNVLNRLQAIEDKDISWGKVRSHQQATIMDPMYVLNTINSILIENERLKRELENQKITIEEQNKKIQSLIDKTNSLSHPLPLMMPAAVKLAKRLEKRFSSRGVMPTKNLSSETNSGYTGIPLTAEYTFPPDSVNQEKEAAAAAKISNLESRLNESDKMICEANAKIDILSKAVENYKKEISLNKRCIMETNSILAELSAKVKEEEELMRNAEFELCQLMAENESLINLNEKIKRSRPDKEFKNINLETFTRNRKALIRLIMRQASNESKAGKKIENLNSVRQASSVILMRMNKKLILKEMKKSETLSVGEEESRMKKIVIVTQPLRKNGQKMPNVAQNAEISFTSSNDKSVGEESLPTKVGLDSESQDKVGDIKIRNVHSVILSMRGVEVEQSKEIAENETKEKGNEITDKTVSNIGENKPDSLIVSKSVVAQIEDENKNTEDGLIEGDVENDEKMDSDRGIITETNVIESASAKSEEESRSGVLSLELGNEAAEDMPYESKNENKTRDENEAKIELSLDTILNNLMEDNSKVIDFKDIGNTDEYNFNDNDWNEIFTLLFDNTLLLDSHQSTQSPKTLILPPDSDDEEWL